MSYLTITSVIKMHLRIRDLREDRDLKQFEIAEYLMCDQSLYSKYEREDRELPLRLAIMLAEFYGVSIDYLVGLTDEPKPYPRVHLLFQTLQNTSRYAFDADWNAPLPII